MIWGGLRDQGAEGSVSVVVTGLPQRHWPAAQRQQNPEDEAERSAERLVGSACPAAGPPGALWGGQPGRGH